MTHRLLLGLASAFLLIPWACTAAGNLQAPPEALLGTWQDEQESGLMVGFSRTHLSVASGGQTHLVAKILGLEGDTIRLCENGHDTIRKIHLAGDRLVMKDPDTNVEHRFRRLPATPLTLEPRAVPLPEARTLSADRVTEIQVELSRRLATDQQVVVPMAKERKEHLPSPWLAQPERRWGSLEDLRRIDVTTDNTQYIKHLVAEVGWIDVGRFGYPTSNAAFLLVQHSGDLPLMLAVLPRIQQDLQAGHAVGEAYALLFDRLQLRLGEKQRYGTQIGRDAAGAPLVLPVENPDAVADLREALGIFPLLQAVKFLGESEVRFSQACTPPSATAQTEAEAPTPAAEGTR